ncbi:MAG: hypothetical protein AAF311_00510 [Pseudomonadota bacterium]
MELVTPVISDDGAGARRIRFGRGRGAGFEAGRGREADRLAAIVAGLGLVLSVAATLWFFAGFFETDPGFAPASAAALLSLGLGAFAIVPCAVVMRMARSAWREGFRHRHGVWTLVLLTPWTLLAGVAAGSSWLPVWLTLGPLIVAVPVMIWAAVSIVLELLSRRAD